MYNTIFRPGPEISLHNKVEIQVSDKSWNTIENIETKQRRVTGQNRVVDHILQYSALSQFAGQ